MRDRQFRQWPRNTKYDTSGMLSRARISWPHDMQAEGGRTMERRSGTRAATTFRKLPSASPGAKATAARAKSTLPLSATRVPELREARSARPRSARPRSGPGEARCGNRRDPPEEHGGTQSRAAGHLRQVGERVDARLAGDSDTHEREAAGRG